MESEMDANANVDYNKGTYQVDEDVEVSAHDKDVRRMRNKYSMVAEHT